MAGLRRALCLAVGLAGLLAGPALAGGSTLEAVAATEARFAAEDARLPPPPLPDRIAALRAAVADCAGALGPTQEPTMRLRLRLGEALAENFEHAAAEAALRPLLADLESQPGGQDDLLAATRSTLAEALRNMNREREAEAMARAALAQQAARLGDADQRTVRTLRRLASAVMEQGRYDEAAAILARAASGAAAPGSDAGPLERARIDLLRGRLELRVGRPQAAAAKLKAVEREMQALLNPDDRRITPVLATLGLAQISAGQVEDALETQLRMVGIDQRTLDPFDPRASGGLVNLGLGLSRLQRYGEAEIYARRSLEIVLRNGGPLTTEAANRYHNLGVVLRNLGRWAEAEDAGRRALAAAEAATGPESINTAFSLHEVALLRLQAGDGAGALPLAARAAAIRERRIGLSHPLTISSAIAEARAMAAIGRTREAIAAFEAIDRRAVEALGETSAVVGAARTEFAKVALEAGDAERAYRLAKAALPGLEARVRFGPAHASQGDRGGLSAVALRAIAAGGGRDPATAFAVMQLMAQSEAAFASIRTAARRSTDDRELIDLADQQRLLADRVAAAERESAAAYLAGDPARIRATGEAMRAARAESLAVDAALSARFPTYAALAGRYRVGLDAFIAGPAPLLAPDEALIQMVQEEDALYLLVATRRGARFSRVDLPAAQAAALVRRIRVSLDIAEAATPQDLPAFDLDAAHALHRAVIAPMAATLAGARVLLVAADGPLASLPLGLLVERPGRGRDAFARYRATRWLADRYGFVTLTTPAALAAARQTIRPSRADRALLAFADPALAPPAELPAARRGLKVRAGARAVCALASLPDTLREARALAQALGADEGAIISGLQATRARLDALNEDRSLRRYRTLLFATHGLLAGGQSAEPALVLTPEGGCAAPDQARDDGILAASAIARLSLDADWVILSGCNTAAGASLTDAPLTGLARAFLYAGARRLLVSHWAVDSAAAADLITATVAGEGGWDGRLASAMRAMRASDGELGFRAHPAFWAPFVIVGEGR